MISKICCCNSAATHTGFLVYYVVAICWFSMVENTDANKYWEKGVVLCVVVLLLHSGVIWFYHGLNFVVAMLLFPIVLLHTSLILALVFMAI